MKVRVTSSETTKAQRVKK